MVPQPVLAVVLLFPITADTERVKADDEAQKNPYPVDPTVMWIKQTVSCRTAGVVSEC
jgi:ubiquitin carboxyl-terminal hydrolase L3